MNHHHLHVILNTLSMLTNLVHYYLHLMYHSLHIHSHIYTITLRTPLMNLNLNCYNDIDNHILNNHIYYSTPFDKVHKYLYIKKKILIYYIIVW